MENPIEPFSAGETVVSSVGDHVSAMTHTVVDGHLLMFLGTSEGLLYEVRVCMYMCVCMCMCLCVFIFVLLGVSVCVICLCVVSVLSGSGCCVLLLAIGGFLKLKCMHMPHTYNVLYRLLSREGNRGEGGGEGRN